MTAFAKLASTILLLLLPTVRSTLVAPNALDLRLTANITHEIPSTLYGYMWEDINHSGDGGLYAELLQNRAFQGVIPGTQNALNAWQPYNGAFLSVTSKTKGVTSSLPNSLEVRVPKVITGPIGFENTGYWGIKVQQGWTYKGSFYAKSDTFHGKISVALKSKQGALYSTASVSGVSKDWKKFTFEFSPSVSAVDDDNVFSVNVDGSDAAGKTIYFGMFSLFPPTFKGRENGMRIDLAEAMAATNPSVWRFPGGNNIEGLSIDTRWKWNETIGPMTVMTFLEAWRIDQDALQTGVIPIRTGLYIYHLKGLLEYLNWAEDLEAEPILGIYSGISIANYSDLTTWPVVPESDLKPPSTALDPAYKKIDFHQYNSPSWFTTNAFMFDNYPRNGTQYFIGEYAVTSTNDQNALGDIPSGRLAYPTLQGAAAEAAFMTGLERNSDVVFAAAYAPSFQHIRNYQWTPDVITYDASRMVKSTSYYAQQMFSVNRGTHVLQTLPASTSDSAPLYWVSSYHNDTNAVFLKVSNTGTADLVANIVSDFSISGFATSVSISTPALSPISGLFNVSNTLEEPELIIPVASSFAIPYPNRFNYTFPATSVTVITLQKL
ncbi:hypothetical protein H0H93_004737 [Arthromyces matolae]|nr:hypothetical protein H0H93_004737 [Arthromyces matolae]